MPKWGLKSSTRTTKKLIEALQFEEEKVLYRTRKLKQRYISSNSAANCFFIVVAVAFLCGMAEAYSLLWHEIAKIRREKSHWHRYFLPFLRIVLVTLRSVF